MRQCCNNLMSCPRSGQHMRISARCSTAPARSHDTIPALLELVWGHPTQRQVICGNIPSWAEIQVCQRQCAQRMSREDAKPSSSKPLLSCPEEARRSRGGRWAEHGCTSPASGEGRSRALPTARLTAAVRTGRRTAMLQSSLKLSNAGPKVLSVMINNSKKSSLHIGI